MGGVSSGRKWPSTRMRGGLLVVRCRSDPPISSIFFSISDRLNAATVASLDHSFADDFFNGGDPGGDLDQAAAPQAEDAAFNRLLLQLEGGGPHQDQFAQLVRDLHHFVESGAALVAGAVAAPQA